MFVIPLALLAGATGIGLSAFQGEKSDASTLVIVIPIVAAAMGFGLFRGLQIHRRGWESFEITVTDQDIVRRQAGIPDIRILGSEIKIINEAPGRGVTVVGSGRVQVITATHRLESYEELVALLRQWNTPWQTADKQHLNLLVLIAAPLVMVGLLAISFLTRGITSAVTSFAVIAFLIWCHREIRRSPHIDEKIKRNSLGIWLVVVSLAFRALLELGLIRL